MNTTTKLNAKTLMQLLATAMITLTLFSCGGGGDDTTTPPATNPTTPTVTPTIISSTATIVSTLSALATGTPSQVVISWSEVTEATSYKLYKSTTTLSSYQGTNPTNLSMLSSTVTVTTLATNTTNIDLSGTQTVYFLVTAIKDGTESFTNATQTAATAFAMPFLTVVSTGTGISGNRIATNRVWMDRNLGASQTAISSTDALAYGDLYQWGRPADGHQMRDSATRTTIANSVTPTHGEFITNAGDWTTADSSGTLRSANWTKIDGSSICPTGFRVPTYSELIAEFQSWSSLTPAGAYASNLKWSAAGIRFYNTLNIRSIGAANYIWSSTAVADNLAYNIRLEGFSDDTFRTYGFSVRCIKPE